MTWRDIDLERAPPVVRRAAEFMAEHEERKVPRMLARLAPLGLFFGGIAVALMVAPYSEPLGLGAWVAMWVGAIPVADWVGESFQNDFFRARSVLARWKELHELGVDADFRVAAPITLDPIERMVKRIRVVGGDRADVVLAATDAAARAHRLRAELVHLDELVGGTDVTLDAARERIHTELAQIRGQVAELYATLLELEANTAPPGSLEDAVARVTAELEVVDRRRPQGDRRPE